MKKLLLLLLLPLAFTACDDDDVVQTTIAEGTFTRSYVQTLRGFGEERDSILTANNVSTTDFIRMSTDSAWSLSATEQVQLKSVRDGVTRPTTSTVLQKVIPLEDLSTYMNNKYGGTIGGFVCEAADVKNLATMEQIYNGMRLDYEGTKFSATGAGYAVIRFCSPSVDKLYIPYAPELGGTYAHSWPNGGGGFTTSTLGDGGYPEWTFAGYFAPAEGAELYEVTPQGRELLRSVYKDGRWQTYESIYYAEPQTKATTADAAPVPVTAEYQGHTFYVRGEADGKYLLTTFTPNLIPGLHVVERGVYGIEVPTSEVTNAKY